VCYTRESPIDDDRESRWWMIGKVATLMPCTPSTRNTSVLYNEHEKLRRPSRGLQENRKPRQCTQEVFNRGVPEVSDKYEVCTRKIHTGCWEAICWSSIVMKLQLIVSIAVELYSLIYAVSYSFSFIYRLIFSLSWYVWKGSSGNDV